MKIARVLLGLIVGLIVAGCTTDFSTRKVMPLDRFQRIYVERRLNDNHRIDEILVAELRRLGRDATSGPLTMIPDKIDAVLTYDTRWEWDFKSYLIELTIELHTVHPRKKIADGRCYQPNIRAKAPEAVIRDLLEPLFAKP